MVGSVYAAFLWLAPDARAAPKMTFAQLMQVAPLGFWAAMAHGGAVYAMTAGAVSFGQIVKAGEPVFACLVGYFAYKSKVSFAKILCLIPVIGGIAIASAKELDFTMASLLAASTANVASAFRGGENKKVMSGDLKAAIGSVGNAYALTTLWAVSQRQRERVCSPVCVAIACAADMIAHWLLASQTVLLIPAIFISGEYQKFGEFKAMWNADGKPGTVGNLRYNTIMSGLTFYLYNEVSTMALKSLSGVSHSVANTAKRAVVIVGSAIAFGEDMGFAKTLGCSIAIGGTFLYAIADDLAKKFGGKPAKGKKA